MKSARALLVVLLLMAAASEFFAADTLPERLTDAEFWKMIQDFSEPDGPFPYENFVSNESNYQTVIPALKQTVKPGGVYLGVAPEQNFTYAAAIQAKVSFIIDIRRQNMLEHLMYKALFEMSDTRADFLSNLFSRPRNAGLADSSGLDGMFDAMDRIQPSRAMFNQTLQAMRQSMARHKFALSSKDLGRIEYIFSAFYNGGPKMDYKFQSATPSQRVPSFARLMLSDDHAGTNWNFLATKAAYDRVRDMQARNVIVPIVGDFAGPKALRSIAKYLRDHGSVVSAFYISNVEYYIQQDGPKKWASYMENLAGLPVGAESIVIRWTSSSDVTSLEPLKPR
jgi:hypothetical protein